MGRDDDNVCASVQCEWDRHTISIVYHTAYTESQSEIHLDNIFNCVYILPPIVCRRLLI